MNVFEKKGFFFFFGGGGVVINFLWIVLELCVILFVNQPLYAEVSRMVKFWIWNIPQRFVGV